MKIGHAKSERIARSATIPVLLTTFTALIATASVILQAHRPAKAYSAPQEHEQLRLKNTFHKPEEVVQYYCARDASGFVWSGLLDHERKAFTAWKESPPQDSFYIAKKYEILPVPASRKKPDQATVEVRYQILGISDMHGTLIPSTEPEYRVIFDLKKIDGRWKIVKPDATQIAPVVLESKFPHLARQ